MGLGCSKRQDAEGDGRGATIVRLSPFRPRRCASLRRALPSLPGAHAGGAGGGPPPLLALATAALAGSLGEQAPGALARLPADLCQLLWDHLVGAGALDDGAVAALRRACGPAPLHVYRLGLGGYHEVVAPPWLALVASPCLEAADLSKTGVTDAALAALGAPPRLRRLRLDYCVELTDAGLCALAGMAGLEELSLAGCEQLTAAGLRCLEGLLRLRRLSLQTCHRISDLPVLHRLHRLEALDVGWCTGLGDDDAEALRCLGGLRELSLARTKVSDVGLACLHGLSRLESLNLAGLQVSDASLAALLRRLPLLRRLCLERCSEAGDQALAAVGQHALQLQELSLGYTAVSDGGLRALAGLTQLTSLCLESCGVGDAGLQVLPSLPQLRSLDISDTGATNGAMPAVGDLPRLECLNLSFTGVDDRGLRHIRRLAALRCLNLDSRGFTDAGLAHLSRLTRLECLDLFGAHVSDAGCVTLGKLRGLRRLEVCGGRLTDGGVAHLASLTGLQHLSLAQNFKVGNGAVSHLLRLGELTALNLSQCRVTSNSVVALGCLPKLQTLALHETRVRPFAVDKLLAANPELEVQGVPPTAKPPAAHL